MIKSYGIAIMESLLLITILNFFLNKSSKKTKKKILWQHYFLGYLLMLYLIISLKDIVGFPCLSKWQRFYFLNESIFKPNINFIPFANGFEISDILNIIFFIPLGFLLPVLWSKYKKLLPTLFYGLIFSSIIEFAQLFSNGRGTDINDLIMNTLGTISGWIIFKIIKNIFIKFTNKTMVESFYNDTILIKFESFLYVFIAIISAFLSWIISIMGIMKFSKIWYN